MPLTSFDAVLQSRPGRLDFLELAETVSAEPLDRNIVVGSARLYSELPVEHRPGQCHRSSEAERPVHRPQVKIESRVVAQFQSPRGFRALYVTVTEFSLTQAYPDLTSDSAPHTFDDGLDSLIVESSGREFRPKQRLEPRHRILCEALSGATAGEAPFVSTESLYFS